MQPISSGDLRLRSTFADPVLPPPALLGQVRLAPSRPPAVTLDLDEALTVLKRCATLARNAWMRTGLAVGGFGLVMWLGAWRAWGEVCSAREQIARCASRAQPAQAPGDAAPPIGASAQINAAAGRALMQDEHRLARGELASSLCNMVGTSGMALSLLCDIDAAVKLLPWLPWLGGRLLGVCIPLICVASGINVWHAIVQLRWVERAAQASPAWQDQASADACADYLAQQRRWLRLKGVAAVALGFGAPLAMWASPFWLVLMLCGVAGQALASTKLQGLVPAELGTAAQAGLGSAKDIDAAVFRLQAIEAALGTCDAQRQAARPPTWWGPLAAKGPLASGANRRLAAWVDPGGAPPSAAAWSQFIAAYRLEEPLQELLPSFPALQPLRGAGPDALAAALLEGNASAALLAGALEHVLLGAGRRSCRSLQLALIRHLLQRAQA
jgi:hypothetical protein